MSLGYAEKLSYRDDVGAVGQKEHWDEDTDVAGKSLELAEMLRSSKKTVIMTGAGISTSIGIPDFRGPNGVWTCQKYGKPIPKLEGLTFASASPSLTHMAIVELLNNGPAQYIVSQNVDGLHRRSGIPEESLAEVHGNCFLEKCQHCGAVYVRDFEMSSVGFQLTGRKCTVNRCRGRLKDMVLDWDDALPDDKLDASEVHAREADLVICLGTSLQIRPICNLPNVAKRNGGGVAIVNLQKTPKNKIADLVIHGKCDEVMQQVMQALGRPLPVYERFHLRLWRATAKKRKAEEQGQLYVVLSSAHGMACPLPMVDHIQWAFSQRSGKVQGCPGALVCDGLYMRRHGGNDLKHEAQMSEVVSQRSSKATRVPVYAASNCKLEDQNAVEYEEGVSEVVAESTGCQQSWVSAEWLKEEAELATAGPSAAAIDSDFVHCSGEVTVDGNEGPITFSVDLNAWPAKSVKASLCLQLTFGCGADACLRNQRVVLDIAVNEVPCIPLVSSAEKMWQAAESCQAALEIKTQVRNFNAEEESTAECKLTGTAVTLRSHSISPPSAIKPPS